MSQREEILAQMEPLFADATMRGQWFQSRYDTRNWFSPAELRDAMNQGRFVWGQSSWIMCDPRQMLHDIARRVIELNREYADTKARLASHGIFE